MGSLGTEATMSYSLLGPQHLPHGLACSNFRSPLPLWGEVMFTHFLYLTQRALFTGGP